MVTLKDSSAHLVDVDEKFFSGGVSDTSSFGLKTSVVNSLKFNNINIIMINIIVRFEITSVSILIKSMTTF